MRDVNAFIEEARAMCTPRRQLCLSEYRTLMGDYFDTGGMFALINACFYFGFAVGVRQEKARRRAK